MRSRLVPFLFLLALLACLSAKPLQAADTPCLNNCWMNQNQQCTICHFTGGPQKPMCENCRADCYECWEIGYVDGLPAARVPFNRNHTNPLLRGESLIGYIRDLTGMKPDRLAWKGNTIDPRLHLKLMQAAALKTDVTTMGGCVKAFKPATVVLLPAEIDKTRNALQLMARK